jgi:hypothetical protein
MRREGQVLEYLHEIEAGRVLLRVWGKVQQADFSGEEAELQERELHKLLQEDATWGPEDTVSVPNLIHQIADLPWVAAVQVQVKGRTACIIYNDWP